MRCGHDGSIDDDDDDGVDGVIMNACLWGDVVENALQRSNLGTAMPKRNERLVRLEVVDFVWIFIFNLDYFIFTIEPPADSGPIDDATGDTLLYRFNNDGDCPLS